MIETLINLGNKINIIQLNFAKKINFRIQKTNVNTQKIDSNK